MRYLIPFHVQVVVADRIIFTRQDHAGMSGMGKPVDAVELQSSKIYVICSVIMISHVLQSRSKSREVFTFIRCTLSVSVEAFVPLFDPES